MTEPSPTGFAAAFPPRRGRTHEVQGPGAQVFAAVLAGVLDAPVLWVRPPRGLDPLHPPGLARFCDPSALLFAAAPNPTEVLAVAEEALRSGAVAAVIFEVTKPLTLTAGRRLQLAAEAGQSLGLALISEGLGSPAAETRWHCAPLLSPEDSTLWRWSLTKNKSGTIDSWDLRWDDETHRIAVVAASGGGPGPAGAPG
ncbi:protein ImuA [Rhodobacter viridis]|uniref:Protein ImuA n=1 Tax=Rhodobacter viridis TaxID=1054202 RepID=A0A318U135_9RHOB|nr:hypothetical protein [Rhodobacter viridis]PYF08105.1 protein ImuA [Rhodobacter viridis]